MLLLLQAALRFHLSTFSPLFIGARNVTYLKLKSEEDRIVFQSPFHRGKECYSMGCEGGVKRLNLSVPFSSGQGMLLRNRRGWDGIYKLSVPFSSGQGMLLFLFNSRRRLYRLSVPFSSGQGMLLTTLLSKVD